MTSGVAITEERRMSVESETIHTQHRSLPLTSMQLAGHATTEVVQGIGRTPLMLGVIVLNLIGVGAAVFFLNLLISGQQQHLKALLEVQDKQQTELITMHKQEFDQLLQMIPSGGAPPLPPVMPPPQPGQRR
jgi:hypothetical protein